MNATISEQLQKYVGDKETVVRLISSPMGYSETTGVSPDCFRLFRKNESYISIERLSITPIEEIMAGGENIRKWFDEGEFFWGAAFLGVAKIRANPRLFVVSKYSPTHQGHAGIEMYRNNDIIYKTQKDEPTPHEILILQLYLSAIVEKVMRKPV